MKKVLNKKAKDLEDPMNTKTSNNPLKKKNLKKSIKKKKTFKKVIKEKVVALLEDPNISSKNKNEKSLTKFTTTTIDGTSIEVKVTNRFIGSAKFEALNKRGVSEKTLKAFESMQLQHMTSLQSKMIPPLLKGRDLLIKAGNNNGKMLAYLIKAVEAVHQLNFTSKHGTGAIIIVPCNEYATEIRGILAELMTDNNQTTGVVADGKFKDQEVKRLVQGINILIATPGRLLYHLNNTNNFVFKNLQYLVVDAAEKIVQLGFSSQMKKILGMLPSCRQSVFSTQDLMITEDLVKIVLKKLPLFIENESTSSSLSVTNKSGIKYVSYESDKKFFYLYSLLNGLKDKKVVIYFSSASSAKHHENLLNHFNIECSSIYGGLEQSEKQATFLRFCNIKTGVLLCSELAAQDINMSLVDVIIQYDQPSGLQNFVKRCNDQTTLETILFIRTEEMEFLSMLEKDDIEVSKVDLPISKIANVQQKVESFIQTVYVLHMSAHEAYKSYIRSYAVHTMKEVFNVKKIDLVKVSKSFGLHAPPFVQLDSLMGKL